MIYKEYYPQKTITSDMIQCKICNEYSLPLGMPSHLRRKHNLSSIDYYNKYIKTESEGTYKICGKPTSFRGLQVGYSKYCSSRCANLDPEVQEKLKKSNLKKYGVEYPLQSQKVKDKIKQTCIDKYGVDSYMKTDSFRKKTVEAIKSDNAIGISENKIYARNCTIKEVSQNDTDNFLNINHLQGKIKATYRLGLYYKDELVQLICIGKSRFKDNEVELLRMCTKLNTRVIGGFSKLLNYQPYSKIISYVDRAKFDGNSYSKIGFEIVSETGPSYKYYKHNVELNRIATQKYRLPELLGDKFNSNETESQNMIRNGWLQVYDCGTIKMQWVR